MRFYKFLKSEYFLVFFLYLSVAVILTFPLIIKLGNAFYGYSGDNLGALHYFWWWKYTFLHHLDLRNSFWEQAPFGFKLDSETGTVFYYWPLELLTLIFNSVSAYNLVLIFSFPLSGLAAYFLTKEFTNNSQVSFWAGLIFTFSPYHFWKAYNHLDLALIWSFPLAILFFLRIIKTLSGGQRLRRRDIILGAIFTAATVLTNFYYAFFLFITLGVIFISWSVIHRLSPRVSFPPLFIMMLLAFFLSFPFVSGTVLDAYANKGRDQSLARQANYDRPILDAVSLSARPWDYLIPSTDNPLFGRFVPGLYNWISHQGKDFKVISGPVHERTIFLGYVSLALNLIGAGLLIFSRNFRQRYGRIVLVFLLTSLSLFVISMPPYIFIKEKTIYLPSFFLYKIAPMFRTYSRLGIFVLLTAALTAALVLNFIFEHLSTCRRKILLLLIILASALEFINVPPGKVIDLKISSALAYVGRETGNFNVVIYPKEFNVVEAQVFEPQVEKGILNFHSQSPYYKLWNYLDDFHNPKTYSLLSALGIKYALFQKELIFPEVNPVDDLWYTRALRSPLGTLPPGLTLVKDYPDSAVYAVTASPVGLVVLSKGNVKVFPQGKNISISNLDSRIYFANLEDGLLPSFSLLLMGSPAEILRIIPSGENVDLTTEKTAGGLNLTVKLLGQSGSIFLGSLGSAPLKLTSMTVGPVSWSHSLPED
ncbi:MAG: hypothetical protein M1352_02965 [Patescibacteria group bacterium]|nr:hypothetical protein [Patescibacteria group bacterium]